VIRRVQKLVVTKHKGKRALAKREEPGMYWENPLTFFLDKQGQNLTKARLEKNQAADGQNGGRKLGDNNLSMPK